jgi:hypothetical protein
MIGETAAAAVAKLRADLPDVTSSDLGAAQGAMGVRARGAVIDKNERSMSDLHRDSFLVKARRDFIATFCWEDSPRRTTIPSIAI